jgi:SNF2 family DNA or RNA helicase
VQGPTRNVAGGSSSWSKLLDILDECLRRQYQVRALRYDGTVKAKQRAMVQDAFNTTDPSIPILITAGAGDVGLNITAANIVIQTEIRWNANNEAQALCRAHRMGQKKSVKYARMAAENSAIDMECPNARQTRDTPTGS